PLKRYRWSSYPWYLNRAGQGPSWLCRQRVLEEFGRGKAAIKGYEAYMEGRVGIGDEGGAGGMGGKMEGTAAGLVCGRGRLCGEVAPQAGASGGGTSAGI